MNIQLQRWLNNVENFISDSSVYPVYGTVLGIGKIALGGVQLSCASLTALGSLLALPFTRDLTLTKHAWTHIKHGTGNILAGAFEALPVSQQIVFVTRKLRERANCGKLMSRANCRKLMPYEALEEERRKVHEESLAKRYDPDVNVHVNI